MRGVGIAVRSDPGDATDARVTGGIVSATEAASRSRFADGMPAIGDFDDILGGAQWWAMQAQAGATEEVSNTEGTDKYAHLGLRSSSLCDINLSLTDLWIALQMSGV